MNFFEESTFWIDMKKLLQVPETYDAMYTDGGYQKVFDLPYKRSPYYPLFCSVRAKIRTNDVNEVLEVGCGTGALAHMIFDSTKLSYRGFDFSPVAVERAKNRTGRQSLFFVGDATSLATYADVSYDTVICTEVLEHIEDDLLAISHWASGTFCVCSVPNFDADTHVRHFRSAAEVAQRYSGLLDIQSIEKIQKPFLNDLTFGNWLQALKWNRYRPNRLRWLFGFSDFDRNGGWFVFTGRRLKT